MSTTPTTPIPLAQLPALRQARARAVLDYLGCDGHETMSRLAAHFVRRFPGDHLEWTAAQLERAVDDLAAAGIVTVEPRGYGGLMVALTIEAGGEG